MGNKTKENVMKNKIFNKFSDVVETLREESPKETGFVILSSVYEDPESTMRQFRSALEDAEGILDDDVLPSAHMVLFFEREQKKAYDAK